MQCRVTFFSHLILALCYDISLLVNYQSPEWTTIAGLHIFDSQINGFVNVGSMRVIIEG